MIPELPRTSVGSVLWRALKDLLNGERLADTDPLCTPAVLDRIAVEIRYGGRIEGIWERWLSVRR